MVIFWGRTGQAFTLGYGRFGDVAGAGGGVFTSSSRSSLCSAGSVAKFWNEGHGAERRCATNGTVVGAVQTIPLDLLPRRQYDVHWLPRQCEAGRLASLRRIVGRRPRRRAERRLPVGIAFFIDDERSGPDANCVTLGPTSGALNYAAAVEPEVAAAARTDCRNGADAAAQRR